MIRKSNSFFLTSTSLNPQKDPKKRLNTSDSFKSSQILPTLNQTTQINNFVSKLKYVDSYKNLKKIKEIRSFHIQPQTPISSYLNKINEKKLLPLQLGLINNDRGACEKLDLKNFSIGDEYAEALSEALRSLKIRTLILNRNGLKDDGIIKLLENIDFKYLKILDLSQNYLTIKSIEKLALCLSTRKKSYIGELQILSLKNCKLNDKCIQTLTTSLLQTDKLKQIDLSNNQIQDEGATYLSSFIFYTETLEIFDLSWNKIRGVGGKDLCKAIGDNNSLKSLNLSWNSLGSPSESLCSKFLSESLSRNHRLVHLGISHARFSEQDCTLIDSGLAYNSSLIGLDFEGNFGRLDAKGFIKPGIAKEKFSSQKNIDWVEDENISNLNMCWICGKWNELEIRFTRKDVDNVKVHLEIDDFYPTLMEKFGSEYELVRMCPPGIIHFFFSSNGKIYLSEEFSVVSKKVGKYPDVELVNIANVKPAAESLWINVDSRAKPRNRDSEKLKYQLTVSYIFQDYIFDSADLMNDCFYEDISKSNLKTIFGKDYENISLHLKTSYQAVRETYKHFAAKAWHDWDKWIQVLNKFFTKNEILAQSDPYLKELENTITTFKYWNSTTYIHFTRSNFIELIVRIAINKYYKVKQGKRIHQAIKVFFRNYFDSFDKYNSHDFRTEKLFTKATELALDKHRRLLLKAYHKRGPDFKFGDFRSTVSKINDDPKILQKAFVLSKQPQSTFCYFDDNLRFTEFVEAVVRTIDFSRPNTSSGSFKDQIENRIKLISD